MKTLKPQTDYTAMTNGFQLVMPPDCEVKIAKNAPVRLLNAVMERMDYSKLYAAYSRLGRIEYSPKILLKIMVYVKQDLDFRRFLLRGNTKVAAEWLLFSLALNILRLHHKTQNGRLESSLIVSSSFPAGL
ncbi:MAG: hypothetical protein U0J65_00040 [Christensenellales bacterium]|nr:hypothetical protein [Christensenellales bacterium]